MNHSIYITGHKNPDTDSICSALAYANLKKLIGVDAIACRLGELNTETEFVLNKFQVAPPMLIHSARCKLSDIAIDQAELVSPDTTIKEAWDLIIRIKNKSLFVVDEQKRLIGVVSMSSLSNVLMSDYENIQSFMKKTPLSNIQKTLNATYLVESKSYRSSGYVHILVSSDLSDCEDVCEDSIVILGNQKEIQEKAILQGATCMIVIGNGEISDEVKQLAKERNCSILSTPYGALQAARLIYQTPSIDNVMGGDVIVFHDREFVEDVSDKMSKTRYRSYPVLDEHKCVIGAVSRFHLFNYEKKKFILLDHNERSQSVNDLEMAEVLEIVDHHRIGDIETSNPINFRNQQIGSTCSIVAMMYREHGIKPDPTIAGLLCCAIISDTMNFNSPTSTALDKAIADELAEIAGIDTDALAKEMYESVATLRFKSFSEILYNDFKEFSIEGSRLGIGQINLLDIRELEIIKKEFMNYMEKVNNANHYDLLLMVFTNAEGKGSNLVFVGSKGWIIDQAFKDANKEKMYFVENVVSRKKQLIPAISKVLKEITV